MFVMYFEKFENINKSKPFSLDGVTPTVNHWHEYCKNALLIILPYGNSSKCVTVSLPSLVLFQSLCITGRFYSNFGLAWRWRGAGSSSACDTTAVSNLWLQSDEAGGSADRLLFNCNWQP